MSAGFLMLPRPEACRDRVGAFGFLSGCQSWNIKHVIRKLTNRRDRLAKYSLYSVQPSSLKCEYFVDLFWLAAFLVRIRKRRGSNW